MREMISSNEEKVLIDLKPTSSSEWIGLIVSAESGIMYPSVVKLEEAHHRHQLVAMVVDRQQIDP